MAPNNTTGMDMNRPSFEEVARQGILSRLRQVADLVEQDFTGRVAEVQELLAELCDRVAASELARCCDDHYAGRQQPMLLCRTALDAGEGEPPTEFLLIPFGEVRVESLCVGDDFVFTRRHAEEAKRWFDRLGRKLAIDYEHQSFEQFNRRPDGLRPAAGWVGGLEIRDDGLWAVDVVWTDRAAELLRAKEYRYFSPVVFWADEDRTSVAALGPVALTNDPAMHGVPSLAAARDARGGGERVDEGEVGGAGDSAVRAQLVAARAEISLLRRQLAAQEADAFVERGLRMGKILDSTSMDWREDYLRDPERAEERLARAPVLLEPGRLVGLDRRGAVRASVNEVQVPVEGVELYRRWGVTAEDLAAYERAQATGRVTLGGRVGS